MIFLMDIQIIFRFSEHIPHPIPSSTGLRWSPIPSHPIHRPSGLRWSPVVGRAEGGPQHLLGLRGHRRRQLHRLHRRGGAGAGGLGGPAKRLGPLGRWGQGGMMGKNLGKSHEKPTGNWEMKVGNAPFFLD